MPAKKKQENELLKSAAMAAIRLIQEPEVRAQIAQGGSAVLNAMQQKSQRRAERKSVPAPEDGQDATTERRSAKEVVTSPFGNQKLARRAQNLSENVELLRGSVSPEAAEALGEFEAVVNRLQVAVAMAGNLPIGKRQKAHREIDSVLDDLERAVFAAVMQ